MKRIAFFSAAILSVVVAYGPPPQASNQIPQSGSGCGPGGCRNIGTSSGCGPGGCPGTGGCGPGGCPGGNKKPYWWEGSTNPFKGCIPGTPGCRITSSAPVKSSPGRPGSVSLVHTISAPSHSGCTPGTPGCPSKSYPDSGTVGHSDPGRVDSNIHSSSQPGCAPGQFGCGVQPVPVSSGPTGQFDSGTVTTNIHSVSQPGCAPGQFGCAPESVPISSGPTGQYDSGTVTTNIQSVSQSGCAPGQFGCSPDPVPFDSGPIGQSGPGPVTTNVHSVSQSGCSPGQFGCAPQSVPISSGPVQHSPPRPSDCRPGTANCGPYEEDLGTDIIIDIVETPEKPIIQFPSHSVSSGSNFPGPTGSFSQSIKPANGFPQSPSSGSVHSVPGSGSNDYSDSQSSGSFVSNTQSFPSANQHQGTFSSGSYKPDQQQPGFQSGIGSFQSNVPGLPFRQGDINPEDLRPISTGVSLNGVSMMMMPMAMPLPGGSCSAGSFCVPANTCNPYNGFIIRNVNMIAAVRRDQPQVPLLECFVPAGVLSDGVCCQESHPIAGTGLD